jgi:hypothetical protein
MDGYSVVAAFVEYRCIVFPGNYTSEHSNKNNARNRNTIITTNIIKVLTHVESTSHRDVEILAGSVR